MTHSKGIVDSDAFVLSISGLWIAVRTIGSGDPVLLFNGMSRPMESWTVFADALRDRTVITFDGPGVGASETPITGCDRVHRDADTVFGLRRVN